MWTDDCVEDPSCFVENTIIPTGQNCLLSLRLKTLEARRKLSQQDGSPPYSIHQVRHALNAGLPNQETATRDGTLIVATIYLQLIQNRYMFRSFLSFNVVTSIVYNPLPAMWKS